jgi:hypothetical protein
MLSSKPNPIKLAISELPPWLKKGKLRPVLGSKPDTTPKFKKA